VSKKGQSKRPTFAQIVAAVDAIPAVVEEPKAIRPGLFNDDKLYDPEGRELMANSDRALEPKEVRAAVLAGARLVWDSCGCGGYCNSLEWPDMVALRHEAESSSPRFRKNNPVRVELLTGSGGDVLLASGGMQWGDVIR
jgi:hypothetical protein